MLEKFCSLVFFREKKELVTELTPQREDYLNNVYLREKYILPPEVSSKMESVADELMQRFPHFSFLTVVGGLANGSHMLRRLENTRKKIPNSDLDFYLGGHDVDAAGLSEMAKLVQAGARDIGLLADPKLNGECTYEYLNLDRIGQHVENDELNLLALPFQASFGRVKEAQQGVLESVLSRPDSQEVWEKVINWHIQSLSMHHRSWSIPFLNYILNEYMPKKVSKFQLAATPQEMKASLR